MHLVVMGTVIYVCMVLTYAGIVWFVRARSQALSGWKESPMKSSKPRQSCFVRYKRKVWSVLA